jgi:hypothetical protein
MLERPEKDIGDAILGNEKSLQQEFEPDIPLLHLIQAYFTTIVLMASAYLRQSIREAVQPSTEFFAEWFPNHSTFPE